MTTLLTCGNSEGERRCDAKCYNATTPECDCCCGGVNHGKGLVVATANVRAMAERVIDNATSLSPELRQDLKGQLGFNLDGPK